MEFTKPRPPTRLELVPAQLLVGGEQLDETGLLLQSVLGRAQLSDHLGADVRLKWE